MRGLDCRINLIRFHDIPGVDLEGADTVSYTHLDVYKRQVPIVPETMSANKLMKLFMQQKKTIAVVVDEFGGTSGIVSLEDLVEEIFGDIEDEHDNTSYISKQIDEHEYVLSGRLEIEKVNETFGLDPVSYTHLDVYKRQG